MFAFRCTVGLLACSLTLTITSVAQIHHGMLKPELDKASEPFSYFWNPTDVLGTLYAPVASEVTPEGYIFTGFGELMFYVGNPPEPVNQRVKTLHKGYLPIVQYEFVQDGIQYSFQMFAANAGGSLSNVPVNLVQVKVKNIVAESRTAFVGSGWRNSPVYETLERKQYRFEQRFDLLPKELTEGQMDFNPDWKYEFLDDGLIRNDRLIYLFPGQPAYHQRSMSRQDNGLRKFRYFTGEISEDKRFSLKLGPHVPMGVAVWRFQLEPAQEESLVFKMPLAPVPLGGEAERLVRSLNYDKALADTVKSWDSLVANQSVLSFPEAKVQESLLANAITMLLAIDRVGDDYIMNVNKFQYHSWFSTDGALMSVALDQLGLHKEVEQTLYYSLKRSLEGSYISHPGLYNLYESFGHVAWSWARHFVLTQNEDFLRKVYPGLQMGMAWEKKVTSEDAHGVIPPATIYDDAQLKDVRQTGQTMWTLVGVRNAIRVARWVGEEPQAKEWEAEYQRLWAAFEKMLNLQTAKSGGYIPPALEKTLAGNDWDNLHTLYPERLFEPFDPRVTATIKSSRSRYQEGILTYVLPRATDRKGDSFEFNDIPLLHYWHTTDNSFNALVRGSKEDQKLVVKDLYALLLHTTSTHATQEFGTEPWGTRDFAIWTNILPDGSTSAVLLDLLRQMLIRDPDDGLHLFSAVSPEWVKPGKKIDVKKAPSSYGLITASLAGLKGELRMEFAPEFRQAPSRIVFHIPWFFDASSVIVDGKPAKVENDSVVITPATKVVRVIGKRRAGEEMSFDDAVTEYKREYAKRYEQFLKAGKK